MTYLKKLRTILVYLYALFLLYLIPTFFFNYGGAWLNKIAELFPIQEMQTDSLSIEHKSN